MKVAYISGPYLADTADRIQSNIDKAKDVAIKYWGLGYAVICPHLNTVHFDGLYMDDVWLKGDIEIVKRCDVIVMIDGWKDSKGATEEWYVALKNNLDVVYE